MTLDTLALPVFLRDRLDHWAQQRPDATAVTYGETTYTWGQWRSRIMQLTGALHSAGIKRGDRILTFELNHLAIIELTFAASALGAGTVVGNVRLAPGQLVYILADATPRIVLYGADQAATVAAAGTETPLPRTLVIGGDNDEYEPFLAAGSADDAPGADESGVQPDDAVLVMYTSGTHGTAQGCGADAHQR